MLALPRVEGALNSVLGMSSRFLRTAEHPAAENLPMLRGVIRSSHEKHRKKLDEVEIPLKKRIIDFL